MSSERAIPPEFSLMRECCEQQACTGLLPHWFAAGCMGVLLSCMTNVGEAEDALAANSAAPMVRLITLDPGHFHASLVQKSAYPQVSPEVFVYAPEGNDLREHLKRIESFNTRAENPTRWRQKVYTGPDFLQRMALEKPGNVVVISGNNTRKTEYINFSVEAGLNVLADKPMAITPEDFAVLRAAFDEARKNGVLVYDIMTERHEITAMLQRELTLMPEVFGRFEKGTAEKPAVIMASLHYFFKEVAGKPLIRPAWFFDVRQEGEAIPDVGTHLIDLVQWTCFPDLALNWRRDVRVFSARRWATQVTAAQFKKAPGLDSFPGFLKREVGPNGKLEVYQNGEVNYGVRGVHARVTALWDFEPPPEAKDTYDSTIRGTRATIMVRQGREQRYKPALYVECTSETAGFDHALRAGIERLSNRWPGLGLSCDGKRYQVLIPEEYNVGHEAHFAEVTRDFLNYLGAGKMPDSEVPNMLAKYYTTTEAYRLSHKRIDR